MKKTIERNREREAAAMKLATMIIDWDNNHPGDDDATMEVSPDQWKDWIGLAAEVAKER